MQPSLQAGSVTGWGGTLASTTPFGKVLPVTVGAGSSKTLILILQSDNVHSSGWTVKFNDVAMTLLYAQAISSNVTNSFWYMHNPPEGTFNAFVGVGAWYGQKCAFQCSVWNDVDQASAFGTPVAQSATSQASPYTATIAATADDVTLNSFAIYSTSAPTITPGASQVQMNSALAVGTSRYGVSSYKLGSSSSVSNSWTGGTSTQPAQLSVVLKGAAGSSAVDATASGATLTGTATLTPGTASSDSPADATAPGATLTGTATLTPGTATGQQSATAPGATLTGTSTLTPGSATAASAGVFVTDISINNTGSVMTNTFVKWRWNQGDPFDEAISVTFGTGTTDAAGRLTVTGLPTGFGWLLYGTPDRVSLCYDEGTVT